MVFPSLPQYTRLAYKPVEGSLLTAGGGGAGAPFQWAAIFPKSSITFDRGVRGLEFYCSSHYTREYEVPAKVSCSYCRTPIMDEGRNVCLLFPESIEFGEEEEEGERVKRCFEVSCVIPFFGFRWVVSGMG